MGTVSVPLSPGLPPPPNHQKSVPFFVHFSSKQPKKGLYDYMSLRFEHQFEFRLPVSYERLSRVSFAGSKLFQVCELFKGV